MAALAIYYAVVAVIGPHYTAVCGKDKYRDVETCEYWDIVTAVALRGLGFLDDHNGFVACLAGVAVAIFTGVLWRSTEKLWSSSERQIGLVKEAGDLAERQLALAARQTDILEKQHEIGRMQFLATHRPKIILREAFVGSVVSGQQIDALFSLANIGETAGTITNSYVALEVVDESTERLFLHGSIEQHSDLGIVRLAPGQQQIFAYPHGNAPRWHPINFGKMPGGQGGRRKTIHLTGQILYVDELGVPRRTAFRRVLKPERQRFYRLPNDYEPDLDYAD
ncbi:MAG: hypothetical protein V4472_17210 [Pseudomonadota bacterium]